MNDPKTIDFIVRCDAGQRHGGDVSQVNNYAENLRILGYDVEIHRAASRLRLREGSIAHFFNTARPYELLNSVNAARDSHIIAVSPIHHSIRDFRRMRRAEVGQGLRSQAGRLPESVREWLATTARRRALGIDDRTDVVRDTIENLRYLPRLRRLIGECLETADVVFTLSRVEEECLKVETHWSGANSVRIKNGAPVVGERGLAWKQRSSDLICIGRIEPRKRQLEIARIAQRLGIHVTFMGGTNEDAPRYAQEFQRVVSSTDSLTWLGQRSAEEVNTKLASSRVLVNASWAEVQSLVDLEALANGCLVYCCLTGSTYEHSPRTTWVYGMDDLERMVASASERAKLDEAPLHPASDGYDWTWMDAATALSQEYERLRSSGF